MDQARWFSISASSMATVWGMAFHLGGGQNRLTRLAGIHVSRKMLKPISAGMRFMDSFFSHQQISAASSVLPS